MPARKSVSMLAAAVALLGSSTPAYAFDSSQAPAGGSVPPAHVTASHPTGSSDLGLELAAGGIVVLAGGGLAVWQLRRRPTRAVHKARAVSGS
jgi:hypothetical protein